MEREAYSQNQMTWIRMIAFQLIQRTILRDKRRICLTSPLQQHRERNDGATAPPQQPNKMWHNFLVH